MVPLLVVAAILGGTVAMAVRMLSHGVRSLPLDADVLRHSPKVLRAAIESARSPAFDALRFAARAAGAQERERWLFEVDGEWNYLLRSQTPELRAGIRVATSASFCGAAWAIRAGLGDAANARGLTLYGPLGQALGCVMLGVVATGCLAALHRSGEKSLKRERNAYAGLIVCVENLEMHAECAKTTAQRAR